MSTQQKPGSVWINSDYEAKLPPEHQAVTLPTMPLRLAVFGFFSSLVLQSSLLAQPAALPQANATAPVTKQFRLSRHYNYQERVYAPPVRLPLLKPQSPRPPRLGSAEQALLVHLSMMKILSFNGWLSTWDAASRQKLLERQQAAKRAPEYWLKPWQAQFRTADSITLVRWILTGTYVIVTYRLTPKQPTETAVAFRLTEGEWRATLDLENDPVFLHFGDARTTFETIIR